MRRSTDQDELEVSELAPSIGELTTGNPFLVCELWRALVESDALEVAPRKSAKCLGYGVTLNQKQRWYMGDLVGVAHAVSAAGIVQRLGTDLTDAHLALLVLAIGAGSLFFSHVNDAGFWLVKEYFGLTVGQTIRSWSVMETVISVVGLLGVLLLSLVV